MQYILTEEEYQALTGQTIYKRCIEKLAQTIKEYQCGEVESLEALALGLSQATAQLSGSYGFLASFAIQTASMPTKRSNEKEE